MAHKHSYLNLLAYFSGEQSFLRALILSLLVWGACCVIYLSAISSRAALASWEPSQLTIGVALPAIAATLWVLWHCASQIPSVAFKLVLRGLISTVAFGFCFLALLLFFAGFVSPSASLVGLAAFTLLAAWATFRTQWSPNQSSKRAREKPRAA
jgi:hypothetical protein